MAAIDKELKESLGKAAQKALDVEVNPQEIVIEIPKRKE